jgi:hypothetical protein
LRVHFILVVICIAQAVFGTKIKHRFKILSSITSFIFICLAFIADRLRGINRYPRLDGFAPILLAQGLHIHPYNKGDILRCVLCLSQCL